MRIDVLGELAVHRGAGPVALPQSRKARALLAWLVLTGRSHRREALCELLWDVADDPRAALRWCLTRLRPVVDAPDHVRLMATRADVELDRSGLVVDLHEVAARLEAGPGKLDASELQALAGRFRGELLEGLDLPDFHDFQLWLASQREQARALEVSVLDALAGVADPELAVTAARKRVQLDPLDEAGRARLVRLLLQAGHRYEAEQQLDMGRRLLQRFNVRVTGELTSAWRETPPRGLPTPPPAPPPAARVDEPRLVGREALLAEIRAALAEVASRRAGRVLALRGDLGIGKSRLVTEIAEMARGSGWHVIGATANELDRRRALGPWEAWSDGIAASPGADGSERVGALAARLIEAAGDRPLAVLVDDAHWLDGPSIALLRLLAAAPPASGAVVLIAAREGDLEDHRELRELVERQSTAWVVGPLAPEDIRAVARSAAPDAAEQIAAASAGVPLYAVELARAHADGRDAAAPASVAAAIRSRVERLGEEPAELASWCSVLAAPLEAPVLTAATGWDTPQLVRTLGRLERHRVLHPGADGASWHFSHDLVRAALYSELSVPRRRLMHARIAETLEQQVRGSAIHAEALARHAALSGDDRRAAWACGAAARRNLSMGAPVDAAAMARRGLRHTEALPDPERTARRVELLGVLVTARGWHDSEALLAELDDLGQRALDLGLPDEARQAVHIAAVVRWYGAEFEETVRLSRRVEELARAGAPAEQPAALVEAAKCFAYCEVELPRAEALTREAELLARHHVRQVPSLPLVQGVLRRHAGDDQEALALLRKARGAMLSAGDRVGEFYALEQIVLVHLDRGELDAAERAARSLSEAAAAVPTASEQPFADALAALIRCMRGEPAEGALQEAVLALEQADASQRLAEVLVASSRWAVSAGAAERGLDLARAALAQADRLRRPGMVGRALAALARAEAAAGASPSARSRASELPPEVLTGLSRRALAEAGLIEEDAP